MEEQRKCDKTEKHVHCFYFVKIRPSCEKLEKEEASRQFNLTRSRIKEEITKQKALEPQIKEKIMWFERLDEEIKRKMKFIWYHEHWDWRNQCYTTPIISGQVQITNGFFRLYGKDVYNEIVQLDVEPDRKRYLKKLTKKGVMDVEYLEQVQEELMTTETSSGTTSGGTRELNHLVESMAHRIQHGNENRAREMKIYQEIKTVNKTKELYSEPEPPKRKSYIRPKDGDLKGDIDRKLSKQHKINILLDDMENLKRHLKGQKSKVARLKENLELVRKNITRLNKELEYSTSKRSGACKRANKLADQTKEMKSYYAEYQSIMTNAEELARKGDVVGLKRLCSTQVDGFMSQWCESKGFRDDYETRKLAWKRSTMTSL